MAVKRSEALPREVMSLCGLHGIRHADVQDYRVGDEFVTVITKGGHKFTAQLVNLNMPLPGVPAGPRVAARRKR